MNREALKEDLVRDEGEVLHAYQDSEGKAELMSYAEAKASGRKKYFTGRPCPVGHVAGRWVSTRTCTACTSEKNKTWGLNNRERASTRKRRWCERNGDKQRDAAYKRLYGITLSDYQGLAARQGNACAICFELPVAGKVLHVDHDHKTGAVRGLLCASCNEAIGKLRDDTQLLRSAIRYLEESDRG